MLQYGFCPEGRGNESSDRSSSPSESGSFLLIFARRYLVDYRYNWEKAVDLHLNAEECRDLLDHICEGKDLEQVHRVTRPTYPSEDSTEQYEKVLRLKKLSYDSERLLSLTVHGKRNRKKVFEVPLTHFETVAFAMIADGSISFILGQRMPGENLHQSENSSLPEYNESATRGTLTMRRGAAV